MTSKSYKGNLGGLVGADQSCQSLADAAGLKGKFQAWLGTTNMDPSARFQAEAPYVRVDGVVLADSLTELKTAAALKATVTVEETGDTLSKDILKVWTGKPKMLVGLAVCNDWASQEQSAQGWTASPWVVTDWQASFYANCDTSLPFYCVEVP